VHLAPMAVTRDINRPNRAKTAFRLCQHRCLLDEVIALELAEAWVSQKGLCWKESSGWQSTVQRPLAQSMSIFKVRCSTHVDN